MANEYRHFKMREITAVLQVDFATLLTRDLSCKYLVWKHRTARQMTTIPRWTQWEALYWRRADDGGSSLACTAALLWVVAFQKDDRGGSRCVSQWDWVNSSGTRTWMMEAPVNPANASFQSATMKQRRGSLHYFHTRLGRFMTFSICIGRSWLLWSVFRAKRKNKRAYINKSTRGNWFYLFSFLPVLLNKRTALLWLSYLMKTHKITVTLTNSQKTIPPLSKRR